MFSLCTPTADGSTYVVSASETHRLSRLVLQTQSRTLESWVLMHLNIVSSVFISPEAHHLFIMQNSHELLVHYLTLIG